MSERPSMSDPDRAELVAYLDGELKGDAARRVEAQIANNPTVRAEADSLRRAWDMLDFLTLPDPSPQFTHRTLERLGPLAARSSATPTPRSRWPRAVATAGWAAALVVAVAAGYGASHKLLPREPGDPELVRDLRVIESKRLYEAAEDLDFVRELDAPDLFGDDTVGT